MCLRPFNVYLTMSMIHNLFWVFLCIWFFIGFIGYGIQIALEYNSDKLENYMLNPCFKRFFMFCCLITGPIILYFSIKKEGFHGLRFW